jgi:GTP-binding protein
VLNKIDKLPAGEAEMRAKQLAGAIGHKGPVFAVSAVTGEGTRELVEAAQRFLYAQDEARRAAMQRVLAGSDPSK